MIYDTKRETRQEQQLLSCHENTTHKQKLEDALTWANLFKLVAGHFESHLISANQVISKKLIVFWTEAVLVSLP